MDISNRPINNGIIVLDYGSQYTLLIARRLREIGIYAEVIDGRSEVPPEDFTIQGIILSGGPDSVSDEQSRSMPNWVLASEKPILGICYGMQLLTEAFGGKLRSGEGREYGRSSLIISENPCPLQDALFKGLPKEQTVWMSHGDDVESISDTFYTIGKSESDVIAAISHKEKPYIGLQFHPEVQHSEYGSGILQNFVTNICQAELNWKPSCMVEATDNYLKNTVKDGKVLMAVSGGVDSTVALVLMTKALGPDKVTGVFVDNGLLRKNEVAFVEKCFKDLKIKNFKVLRKADIFLNDLKGVTDPEEKRKKIGLRFIKEFEAYAKSQEGYTHLGQGTLYPDVIESAGHGAGAKVIKSHHNVGGLPEKLNLELAEPFRFLFKDEVRKIGKELGIPDHLIYRHPFPGPGLGVRILGEIDQERVRILQEADHIFIQKLREADLYDKSWQAFSVLLPVKTVGVMGDNRTYQSVLALRAVMATDGMTAGVSPLPMEFLVSVSDEIVRKVDGINRVVYDITTKPPATIEWE